VDEVTEMVRGQAGADRRRRHGWMIMVVFVLAMVGGASIVAALVLPDSRGEILDPVAVGVLVVAGLLMGFAWRTASDIDDGFGIDPPWTRWELVTGGFVAVGLASVPLIFAEVSDYLAVSVGMLVLSVYFAGLAIWYRAVNRRAQAPGKVHSHRAA
jgi:hypothetical protein